MGRNFNFLNHAFDQIINKIISENVFNKSCVYVSLDAEKQETPPSDLYCLMVPGGFRTKPWPDGAGRMATVVDGYISFVIWKMESADESSRDTIAMLIYEKIEQVVDTLQIYDPLLNAGSCDFSFTEPMRLINIERPARHPKAPEWFSIKANFAVTIQMVLDVASPIEL